MIGICVCGHGMDEHEHEYGPCHGQTSDGGPCRCVMFEEDEEDEEDAA